MESIPVEPEAVSTNGTEKRTVTVYRQEQVIKDKQKIFWPVTQSLLSLLDGQPDKVEIREDEADDNDDSLLINEIESDEDLLTEYKKVLNEINSGIDKVVIEEMPEEVLPVIAEKLEVADILVVCSLALTTYEEDKMEAVSFIILALLRLAAEFSEYGESAIDVFKNRLLTGYPGYLYTNSQTEKIPQFSVIYLYSFSSCT